MEGTLPPLVEPEDVPGNSDGEAAAMIVSALARSYMRQTITLVEHDVATVIGTRARRLVVGERPILAVHEVAIDGDPVTDYRWLRSGALVRSGGWRDSEHEITVDYDHGYAVVPDDIRAACASAAGRLADNPGALRSLQAEDVVSYTYAVPAGFTVAELVVLNRYRRRTLA